MKPKLCYVKGHEYGGVAYFTTQDLDKQWGDDWNDVPYEHNAGEPYLWSELYGDRPRWEVVRAAFWGLFYTPCWGQYNSPYSVEDINVYKKAPWLTDESSVKLWAGASIGEFENFITRAGGVTLYI